VSRVKRNTGIRKAPTDNAYPLQALRQA